MQAQYVHGYHHLSNPSKYLGKADAIRYKSHMERVFMHGLDMNPDVIQWASEYHRIKYQLNSKNRIYCPDIFAVLNTPKGKVKLIIEIKPRKETKKPIKRSNTNPKKYADRLSRYKENRAKWAAARLYCKAHNYEFKILTELEIFGELKKHLVELDQIEAVKLLKNMLIKLNAKKATKCRIKLKMANLVNGNKKSAGANT